MRFAPFHVFTVTMTCLAAAAAAQAADIVKPNIKPGLWEVSDNPQVSGQMPIPEAELAKLTPEQRARMESVMKNMSKGGKTHVYKECMTAEKIARFDMNPHGDDSSCKRKVIASSPNELTLHDECDKPSQKTVADMHFAVKGGTAMEGKIKVIITSQDKKTMTVNSTVQGKWLATDCGSVKDSEPER